MQAGGQLELLPGGGGGHSLASPNGPSCSLS